MAGAILSTTIVYSIEGEQVPYRVVVETEPQELTLAQFKLCTKRYNYRFFFLSFDQEFGSLKDELLSEGDLCPSSRGVVQAWLVPLDLSEDTTKMSPMTGTSNNLTGLSENNTGMSGNISSSRIISGCSSNQSSGQQANTISNGAPCLGMFKAKPPGITGGFMTSSPTSWINLTEQRCHSAEMYHEYERNGNPREVFSDTCVEIMARGHRTYADLCGEVPAHEENRSNTSRVGEEIQQGVCPGGYKVGDQTHCPVTSTHSIPEEDVKSKQFMASSVPNISQHNQQKGTLNVHTTEENVKQGLRSTLSGPWVGHFHSDDLELMFPPQHSECSKKTGDSEVSKDKMGFHSFNLAFCEEKSLGNLVTCEITDGKVDGTTAGRFQTSSGTKSGGRPLSLDIDTLQVTRNKAADKSRNRCSVPNKLSLRSEGPKTSTHQSSNCSSKNKFHKRDCQPSTSAFAQNTTSLHVREKPQRGTLERQSTKHKTRMRLNQYISMGQQNEQSPKNNDLASSSQGYIRNLASKHEVPVQATYQEQSFCASGPCSFCENTYPVYQSISNIDNDNLRSAGVSTTDIFCVSPLQRSLDDTTVQESEENAGDFKITGTLYAANKDKQREHLSSMETPAVLKDRAEACSRSQLDLAQLKSPEPTHDKTSLDILCRAHGHSHTSHPEVDCGEIVELEEEEETHTMTQPLIGKDDHVDSMKMKKQDKTDSSESSSAVIQSKSCHQQNLLDWKVADMRETVAFMRNTNFMPEIKERTWLKCVIPNAVIGAELIKWLRLYKHGLTYERDARDYAQEMLDSGVLKSFLSSEKKFKKNTYYTVLDNR